LDLEYPIHAIHIYRIIGLPTYGTDVGWDFQKTAKRGKKIDENNLYKNYGTTRKCHGVVLDMVNNMSVRAAAIIIATKLMCHYTRG